MEQSYYYSIKTNALWGRGFEADREGPRVGEVFPLYHQVINIFINSLSLSVERRPASDHFISPPWVRYRSGSIISLIYIHLL